jgi:hypothetical protein
MVKPTSKALYGRVTTGVVSFIPNRGVVRGVTGMPGHGKSKFKGRVRIGGAGSPGATLISKKKWFRTARVERAHAWNAR